MTPPLPPSPQVEESNQEVIDEVYELYTKLISKTQDLEELSHRYRSYYLV